MPPAQAASASIYGEVFFYFKDPKMKMGYQLNSRYFWKDVNYVQLSLITGAAPDEPWRTDGLLVTKAHTAKLSIATYVERTRSFQLKSEVGYSYEEYQPHVWRSRYMVNIGLIIKI